MKQIIPAQKFFSQKKKNNEQGLTRRKTFWLRKRSTFAEQR
jgi:hypothetical protein